MSDPTPGGWPDASKPGWLPDKGTRRRHWLQFHPRLDARLFWWWPKQQHWTPAEDGWKEEKIASDQMAAWRYLGPLLLPSEVSALRQERDRLRQALQHVTPWVEKYANPQAVLPYNTKPARAALGETDRLNDCGGSDSCCQGPCKARY